MKQVQLRVRPVVKDPLLQVCVRSQNCIFVQVHVLTANGQLYNRSRAVKGNPEVQKSRSAISLYGPVQKLLGLRWFSAVYTWLTQTFGQWKVSKTRRFNSNGGPYSPLARGQKSIYISLISYVSLPGWTSPVPKDLCSV